MFAAGLAKQWVPDLKPAWNNCLRPGLTRGRAGAATSGPDESEFAYGARFAIIRGATTANKAIDPNALLSDPVLALYPDTDTECLGTLAEPDSLGGIAP